MNFIDTAVVTIKAGDGGKGHVSFRREKYVPKGGPDGGNGGDGGSIVVVADSQLGTLLDFRYKRNYKAPSGSPGSTNRCTGASGEDVILRVPCGTVVRNQITGEQLADLESDGTSVVLARGGRGGRGNAEFATSINQTPRHAEPGTPGEELLIELELKLLADVGLVGFPNAGKSTLISVVSAARPRIADYPFTTLTPNLGMVRLGEGRSFTIADIPGLIEGAHEGRRLGLRFLRHIERTAVLVYLIECTDPTPEKTLNILRNELFRHNASLNDKPYMVVLTKSDELDPAGCGKLEQSSFAIGNRACLISAVTGAGVHDLMEALWVYVIQNRYL